MKEVVTKSKEEIFLLLQVHVLYLIRDLLLTSNITDKSNTATIKAIKEVLKKFLSVSSSKKLKIIMMLI